MLKINVISDSTYTVQGHGVHTAFLSQVEGLQERADIEVSVNAFGWGHNVTHIHTFGPLGLWHMLFGSGKKVASAHVIPASLVGSIKGAKLWLPLMKRYLKFFYGRADLVCAVSVEVANSLKQELRIKPTVVVLYNGIPMKKFAFTPQQHIAARQKLHMAKGSFVVASNGQIQPRKRFDSFIAVAKQMPETQFVWIGGAPFGRISDDFSELQKLVESAPSNVLVTGVIPYDQVRDYLAASDVFWLPSAQENHPMAVLEAAGAGLPIVLRDIPEYDDSFKQDALRGTDENFGRILSQLKDDTEYRLKAIEGSHAIAARFDIGTVTDQLLHYYDTQLDQKA